MVQRIIIPLKLKFIKNILNETSNKMGKQKENNYIKELNSKKKMLQD